MKMQRLYNLKHEAFAQLMATGVEVNDAYEQAGYVRRRGNPGRLARKPRVAARIQELKWPHVLTLEYLREKVLASVANLPSVMGDREAAAELASELRCFALAIEQQAGIDAGRSGPADV
jgi:hypothetical protein